MTDRNHRIVFKLTTFNILRDGIGEGGDRRKRIAALISRHNPDVLCMQEGGDDACWRGMADEQGFKYVQNIPGEFQPALFSKLPVKQVATHSGVKFVYFQVDLGRFTLGVYSIHLMHWPPAEGERIAALRKLLALMQVQGDAFVCIAGDFNSRARGEQGLAFGVQCIATFNKCVIGPYDWTRATDSMAMAGFIDCYRRKNQTSGYSLHPLTDGASQQGAPIPKDHLIRIGDRLMMPPVVRIDYVFANPALAERLTQCELDDSDEALQASDHLPLVATFKL
ncbi:MAG: endonuclease/exonuclease/phosphatase family protein [Gammaproteobacteria bacterium]|nr:endonuclease/exonuclease/phosphatase family protein [Gammaproteobacteria bacterium]